MEEKVLTVSIAAYNAEKYLEKCLLSFVSKVPPNIIDKLEIIVVNDGSTDRTLEIANQFSEKYPDSIIVINKENGGHGSTINASIKRSSAKYFKIVDSDDWVETENLIDLIEFLEQQNCDLIMNTYYEVDANNENKKKLIIPHYMDSDYEIYGNSFYDECKKIKLAMHAMTIKSSLIKKMGPIIDENCFYVDMEYILFPLIYFQTITILSYPIYNYLIGTDDQSMNLVNMQKRRNQHLKVIKRIIEFYVNQEGWNLNVETLYVERVLGAVMMQYIIYLSMDSKQSYAEIINFDIWLKKISSRLYNDYVMCEAHKKSMYAKIILHLRKIQFRDYALVNKIVRIGRGLQVKEKQVKNLFIKWNK